MYNQTNARDIRQRCGYCFAGFAGWEECDDAAANYTCKFDEGIYILFAQARNRTVAMNICC